jgi:heme/copper-type cytochrome/quinol oxidase subunit 2
MKWLMTILGLVLTAVGVLWSLQGSGLLAHSAMSGQKMWLIIGVIVGVVGIVLLVSGVVRLASRAGVKE